MEHGYKSNLTPFCCLFFLDIRARRGYWALGWGRYRVRQWYFVRDTRRNPDRILAAA